MDCNQIGLIAMMWLATSVNVAGSYISYRRWKEAGDVIDEAISIRDYYKERIINAKEQ